MSQVESHHQCNKAEVKVNRLFLRTKENLIRIQQFIEDDDNYY